MTTLPDLIYVALLVLAVPLIDYLVFWPAHHRLSQTHPAFTRKWICASSIANQWLLVGFLATYWVARDRYWTSLGFSVPSGWRLWTALAVVLLLAAYYVSAVATVARNSEARAKLGQQVGPLAEVLPHTRAELYWFSGVSLTAGFCEELLYRGYFIWVFAPLLGWWGAAALSLPFFALAHLYQGWNGVFRTGIFGAFYTLLVAIFDSLWPAIALHVLVDLSAGMMAWLVLREELPQRDVAEVKPEAESESAIHREGGSQHGFNAG